MAASSVVELQPGRKHIGTLPVRSIRPPVCPRVISDQPLDTGDPATGEVRDRTFEECSTKPGGSPVSQARRGYQRPDRIQLESGRVQDTISVDQLHRVRLRENRKDGRAAMPSTPYFVEVATDLERFRRDTLPPRFLCSATASPTASSNAAPLKASLIHTGAPDSCSPLMPTAST